MRRARQMSKRSTLIRIIGYTGRSKALLVISFLLSAAGTVSLIYIPVLAGRAIDLAAKAGGPDFAAIKNMLLRIVIFALIGGISSLITGSLNNRISYTAVRNIRDDAIDKLCRLPVSYLDSHPVGDTVSRIISDADQISDGLILGFTQLFTGVITIAGTLAFMLSISPVITPAVVLLTPLSLFIARFIARRAHSMYKRQTEARGAQTALIDETVMSARVIAAYGAGDEMMDRFRKRNDAFAKNSLQAIFFSSLVNPSTRFVNNIIFAAVALAGGLLSLAGGITIGGITAFLAYCGQYAKPFNEISGVIAELQNSFSCAERVFELIDAPEMPPYTDDTGELGEVRGSIETENVCFSYVPGRKFIENLNIKAGEGESIALVGPTGCGKTTIINLLMRFYDADSGHIKIDGRDIYGVTRESLRKNCSMVLQETWIKTGSVKENIAFGRQGITDEEIVKAAKSAHAHSFIKKLPQGYDTVISDESTVLSQGQKQLICIARVMLSLPPVLILDEATSSIDTRTEILIRKSFRQMMKGRTSFTVAHRLSTIMNSDCILVMKDGSIIEHGTHSELMANHGFYEKLFNSRNI